MATNVHQKGVGGPVWQYTNATGASIASGAYVLMGDQGLGGLALETIANAATGSVQVPYGMIIQHNVKGHDGSANAAIDAYDKVYFTAGEAFFDVDTAQKFVGFTLGGVASGATESEYVLVTGPIA